MKFNAWEGRGLIPRYNSKMRYRTILGLAILAATPAHAQQQQQPQPQTQGPQQITVTDRDCAQIVEHVAANDVAYQPGVDVHGKAVAPADLNPQPQIQVPKTITIPITMDLHKFGVPANSPLLLPGAEVGKITVENGNRAYFNGQPLGDAEMKAIAEACRQRGVQQPRR